MCLTAYSVNFSTTAVLRLSRNASPLFLLLANLSTVFGIWVDRPWDGIGEKIFLRSFLKISQTVFFKTA